MKDELTTNLEFGGQSKRSPRWGVRNAIYDNDTSLMDAQWRNTQTDALNPPNVDAPPIDRRRILDAVLHLVKCGCLWRYLPTGFPGWKTVWYVFWQWIGNHQWAALNDVLRTLSARYLQCGVIFNNGDFGH